MILGKLGETAFYTNALRASGQLLIAGTRACTDLETVIHDRKPHKPETRHVYLFPYELPRSLGGMDRRRSFRSARSISRVSQFHPRSNKRHVSIQNLCRSHVSYRIRRSFSSRSVGDRQSMASWDRSKLVPASLSYRNVFPRGTRNVSDDGYTFLSSRRGSASSRVDLPPSIVELLHRKRSIPWFLRAGKEKASDLPSTWTIGNHRRYPYPFTILPFEKGIEGLLPTTIPFDPSSSFLFFIFFFFSFILFFFFPSVCPRLVGRGKDGDMVVEPPTSTCPFCLFLFPWGRFGEGYFVF